MDEIAPKIRERRSARMNTNRFLTWRTHGGRRLRLAGLTEQSLNGMALVIAASDAPARGAIIVPANEAMCKRYGFKKARVRETALVPDGTAIIYAAILS